jgi:hypothetical protein
MFIIVSLYSILFSGYGGVGKSVLVGRGGLGGSVCGKSTKKTTPPTPRVRERGYPKTLAAKRVPLISKKERSSFLISLH